MLWKLFAAVFGFLSPMAGPATVERPQNRPAAVAEAELLEELKSAPVENAERQDRIKELYLQAGAKPEDVTLQPVKLPNEEEAKLHNVIAVKKGRTGGIIVVGGHFDKVGVGRGIIDDWSGSCMATNLYQALRDVETKHTFVFMGFAHEERGLIGSKVYVDSLDDDQKKAIKAMVNLECLGVDDTFLWTNGSTDRLEILAHKVADEAKLPLRDHVLNGVGADSIPFDKVGIPTITFDSLPREKFRFIHSEEDKFENIQADCYGRSYKLVLQYLVALDQGVPEPEAEPEK